MSIITIDGMPVLVNGGLSVDPNCCCTEDSCPPCCGKILGGILSGGTIQYTTTLGGKTVNITITTTSGTRIVCEGDEVTFDIVIDGSFEINQVSASWDVAWKYLTHSPAVSGVDGELFTYSYVDWGALTDETYALSLEYNPCLTSLHPGLGLIQITVDGATFDIELETCPQTTACCEVEEECQACCWYLVGGTFDEATGKYLFYVESLDGMQWMLVAVTIPDPARKLYCPDAQLEFAVVLGSRTKDAQDASNKNLTIDFTGFCYLDADPAPDTVTEIEAEWIATTETEFSIQLEAKCRPCPGGNVTFSMLDNVTMVPLEIVIMFQACDDFGCNCCCDHCCGNCHFPLDYDCTAPAPPGGTPRYEVGGATQITNFTTTITASENAFCFIEDPEDEFGPSIPTTDETTVTQEGLSGHAFTCTRICPDGSGPACAISDCFFYVDLVYDCPGVNAPFRITVEYNTSTNTWFIGPGAWPYWLTGRTSYSGDCNGATAAGSFTDSISGITYTWETSFTVVRTPEDDSFCPLPEDPPVEEP